MKMEAITPEAYNQLSRPEKDQLFKSLIDKFNEATGEERDRVYKQLEGIISQSTKNQVWEVNHSRITVAITKIMREYGRMPSSIELAEETKLSRQTVHKHLKEYVTHPMYLKELEAFKFMTSKVLARVFTFAVNGDVAAAKLYLQTVGFPISSTPVNNTLIQNQNNFIQINGTVVSQEAVKNLNPEQLNMIETILKTAEASCK